LDHQPYLSIIIPAYNEEKRLPQTLEKVAAYLAAQDYSFEVLVVENGSRDQTFAIAQAFAEKHPNFIALRNEQNGKGRAVQRGMLEAKGHYRFICDADLSMPIEQVARFLPPTHENPKIVIGSREAPGAKRHEEPGFRHWGGRAINLAIRVLALHNLHDTQCGFKLFRGDVAEQLFPMQTLMGWSFDVEVLFIARKLGIKIIEQPIDWYYADLSHVQPFKDGLKLLIDLFHIRWNHLTGRYAPHQV
jgi:glycosyltransferase involved in cell wall biosynthesis